MSRRRILILAACAAAVVLGGWALWPGGGAAAGQDIGPDDPEVRRLVDRVQLIRRSRGEQFAVDMVSRWFDDSVAEPRRKALAPRVAAALARADEAAPLEATYHLGDAVRAEWRLDGSRGGQGRICLMFRRTENGTWRLLGPMP